MKKKLFQTEWNIYEDVSAVKIRLSFSFLEMVFVAQNLLSDCDLHV